MVSAEGAGGAWGLGASLARFWLFMLYTLMVRLRLLRVTHHAERLWLFMLSLMVVPNSLVYVRAAPKRNPKPNPNPN